MIFRLYGPEIADPVDWVDRRGELAPLPPPFPEFIVSDEWKT
jgi:hypothetical protein